MAKAPAEELDDEPLGLDGPEALEVPEDEPPPKEAGDDVQYVIAEEPDPEEELPPEEEPAPAEVHADEELSEEDSKLGSKIQDRIRREIRLRKRAVAEAEGRVRAESIGRQAAENEAMELRLVTARIADESLDIQIKQVTKDLKKAAEEGKTDESVDLQAQLNDLQGRRREVQATKAALEDRAERAKKAPPAQDRPAVRPLTQQWMGRNRWFGDKQFVAASAAVKAIDSEMAAEGWNPDETGYYTELDRRIHKELPNLRQRLGQRPGVRQQNRPGPGTTVSPARSAPSKPSGRVVLTPTDFKVMREFGLDPLDKEHLKEFARQKQGGANA